MRRSLSVTFLGVGYAGTLCGTADGDHPFHYSWEGRQGTMQRTYSFYPPRSLESLDNSCKTCFEVFPILFLQEKKKMGREFRSQTQKIKNSNPLLNM